MNAVTIDDHPLAITAIRNLLIKNNVKTLAELIESGNAVRRVEILKPDIAIIDVGISGVNDIQTLETLRKYQYNGIIIIVSIKNDHFYGRHCADTSASSFANEKEGMNNIIAAIETAKNGYCCFPLSLSRFVGSLTPDQQKLDSLSKQEINVMRYILDNKDNNDIAEKMFINNKVVSTYKSCSTERLECKSLMDLHAFAQRSRVG